MPKDLELENKLLRQDLKRKDDAINELALKLYEALEELNDYRTLQLPKQSNQGGINVN